jgi:hypothetical protein
MSSFEIMSSLMKMEEHYKLPMLVAHAAHSRKQHAFIAFIEKLKYTLQTIPELQEVLAKFPILGEPACKEANKALFELLIALCEYPLNVKLDQRREDIDRVDGMDALRFLQDFCWTQDEYQRNNAIAASQSITIGLDEGVAMFNNRFMRAMIVAKVAGI